MTGLAAAQHFQTLSQRAQDGILATLDLNARMELLYWLSQAERQKLLTGRDAQGRFVQVKVNDD